MENQQRALTPHPTRIVYLAAPVVGGLCAVIPVGHMVTGASPSIPVYEIAWLVLGGAVCWLGALGVLRGKAAQAANAATRSMGLGQLDEADRYLDRIAHSRVRLVRRTYHLFRAKTALRRGDIPKAQEHADAVMSLPFELFPSPEERWYAAEARALRAFIGASIADPKSVREDIAAVRSARVTRSAAIGLAAVAEALLLAREGEREALREYLHRERFVLFEATRPRERAIVRALHRMLSAAPTTAYRRQIEPAPSAVEAEEPDLATLATRIAPAAAPFVQDFAPRGHRVTPQGTAAAPRGVPFGILRRVFAVFVFGALVWFAYQELERDPRWGLAPDAMLSLCLGVLGAVVLAFHALVQIREDRARARLYAAEADMARRADRDIEDRFRSLVMDPSAAVSTWAWFHLALMADRRADFDAALQRCDDALRRLGTLGRPFWGFDVPWDQVVGERAFALAALGRRAEATSELAKLPAGSPFRERDELRVRLVELARTGAVDEAVSLAAHSSADLPLSPRDELLRDLIRATWAEATLGAAEVLRLREEMSADAESRKWIETVAPGLRERFERAHAELGEEAGNR
jgi:tetratricopeptide (TPR) repeat protein